jgi:hypothetical protein
LPAASITAGTAEAVTIRSAGNKTGRQLGVSEHDFDLVDGQAHPLADKQREDRIGTGADVLRGAGHTSSTVVANANLYSHITNR